MSWARLLLTFAVLAVAAALLIGCQDNRTRISALLRSPEDYDGRDVLVAGTVLKTFGADLVIAEAGAYQLDDGTGKIWVITKDGLPRTGQNVAVKATVSRGLRIGGESLGAVLRETERRSR